jgi:hypothetical protein
MVEAKRKAAHADLIFYKIGHDGMPIKYLINMPVEETPVFIDNEKALSEYKKPAFVIMRKEEKLPNHLKVIVNNSIGHVNVMVVEINSPR